MNHSLTHLVHYPTPASESVALKPQKHHQQGHQLEILTTVEMVDWKTNGGCGREGKCLVR